MQPDNEIRSANGIYHQKHFPLKLMQKSVKNQAGRLVPDLLLLFKLALYEVKGSG